MLDGRVGRAYADLRRYYDFDLSAWLEGRDNTPLAGVISMLTYLPRSSSFFAHYLASLANEHEDLETGSPFSELSEEEKFERLVDEREEWTDTDIHIAAVVNKLNTVIAMLGDGKSDIDVYGPDFLLPPEEVEKRRKKQEAEYRKSQAKQGQAASSVEGFYKMMGAFAPGVPSEE